jgi:hypothetical protein
MQVRCIAGDQLQRFVFNLPMEAIGAESRMNVHLHRPVVAPEHSRKTRSERHYGTVEYAV